MTAAEVLLSLAERLTEADQRLSALAYENRWKAAIAVHYNAKAEGVRLALDYVTELQRFAGADQ